MDLREPLRAVTPTLDAPVLRVLAGTTSSMTRQQITRLVEDASEAGVRKVLRRLADQGIVLEQRVGTQFTYAANREHVMWSAVEAATTVAERLDSRIRARVDAWSIVPLSVELFGSAATGTATAESDIDLLLYQPHLEENERLVWDEQVADLRNAVELWTGNPCEILEVDPPTLVEMAAKDELVLRSPMQPISGVRLADAVPGTDLAKALRKLAQANSRSLLPESTRRQLAETVLSPAARRTVTEFSKSYNPPLRSAIQDALKAATNAQRSQ